MADPLSPWRLGGLEVPNRVLMGSMHTGFERDGDRLAAFYTERVRGGAGLIVTGGYAVEARGRAVADDVVLGDPAVDEALGRSVEAVHRAGGLIAVQLFHSGRYTAGVPDDAGAVQAPVAPSAVPWRAARGVVPREMTADDIAETLSHYGSAAAHAEELGYDAIEISASEGYLINAFCSPITNLRDDDWGGDAVRRRSFARAAVAAVRAATRLPVVVRISGDDLMKGSTTPAETLALADEVVAAGADAVSVGVGWHESPVPTVQFSVPHGAWLDADERVAAHLAPAGVPVIGSNRILSLDEARAALERTHLAAVALARPFLADPDVVTGALAGRTVIPCIGCNEECIDHSMSGRPISCLVNPRAGRELEAPVVAASTPRRLAVVGAGPAGLVAAVDAARLGHRVTLFEASQAVGGQLRLAGLVAGKSDYLAAALALADRFRELGGELVLGRRVGAADLAGFDAAVLATGVRAREVDVDADGSVEVLSYAQALERGMTVEGAGGAGVEGAGDAGFGDVLVIGGGGVAVDVGATLAPASSSMTLIRRGGRRFAAGTSPSTRWIGLGELRRAGAAMWNNAHLVRVRDGVATVEVAVDGGSDKGRHGAEGLQTGPQAVGTELRQVPVTTIVVAAGSEPMGIDGEIRVPYRVVGGPLDASSLNAARSTRQALEAVRELV